MAGVGAVADLPDSRPARRVDAKRHGPRRGSRAKGDAPVNRSLRTKAGASLRPLLERKDLQYRSPRGSQVTQQDADR